MHCRCERPTVLLLRVQAADPHRRSPTPPLGVRIVGQALPLDATTRGSSRPGAREPVRARAPSGGVAQAESTDAVKPPTHGWLTTAYSYTPWETMKS